MMAIDAHAGRVRLLFICFVIAALALLTKLYLVQIMRGDDFAQKADRQYAPTAGNVFNRGSIFFTDKNGRHISAATIQSGFVLTINPVVLVDADDAYEKLSALTPLDKTLFMKSSAKIDDPYEEVAKGIDKETADTINALELPGVTLYKEQWRLYPAGSRAAHMLGFVGFKGDVRVGQYGLERYYEHVLTRGEDSAYQNFFAEIFNNIEEATDITEGEGAGNLITTIEPTVQGVLEDKLAYVADAWSVKTAGAIIMDPKTGEIIAAAGFPTFDPNDFSDVENLGVFTNPIVEKVYEMGSIVKPLTMAAGLDARVVTPETTYNDKGSLTIDEYTISNYDGRGRGTVDMNQVLGQSLNTGMAFVVGQLGNKRFADYFRSYGLGEETGIDLPGELPGLVDFESPRDLEYITAAYGQGIAITPIAMTRALASLGNGGMLVTPHIVKEIEYDLGVTKSIGHPADERVISSEASRTITRMLVRVVDEWLLGGTVKMDRYSIAAKTGTAQISNKEGGGGYYKDRYLHSFFGYFPAYDPKFIVFLYAEEPKNVNYASETLTHPFMDIAEFLINYYEIPPDR